MTIIPRPHQTEREAAVDPDLPVIDAHMHLCDWAGFDYFSADYLDDVEYGHDVRSSVYIECNMDVPPGALDSASLANETGFAMRERKRARKSAHGLIDGIIGRAELTEGAAVAQTLEAHRAVAGDLFKGVRSRIAWDADPEAGYPGRADFPSTNPALSGRYMDGAKAVEHQGLILEIFALHTQLPFIASVAQQCPGLTIVINHLGGPIGVGAYGSQPEQSRADWMNGLAAVAAHPRVHVKLSGIGVTRLGLDFPDRSSAGIAAVAKPYLDQCVSIFGADRCIFGSNFPVDRAVCDYRLLINAYKSALADRTPKERTAIFADNARRIYGLP